MTKAHWLFLAVLGAMTALLVCLAGRARVSMDAARLLGVCRRFSFRRAGGDGRERRDGRRGGAAGLAGLGGDGCAAAALKAAAAKKKTCIFRADCV